MALLPIFKPCTVEQLTEQFELQLDVPEWVNIEFRVKDVAPHDAWLDDVSDEENTVEYECNRYDAIYTDPIAGKTISVYLYMNETRDRLIAIDDVVQDVNEKDARYSLTDTPLYNIIQTLKGEIRI